MLHSVLAIGLLLHQLRVRLEMDAPHVRLDRVVDPSQRHDERGVFSDVVGCNADVLKLLWASFACRFERCQDFSRGIVRGSFRAFCCCALPQRANLDDRSIRDDFISARISGRRAEYLAKVPQLRVACTLCVFAHMVLRI